MGRQIGAGKLTLSRTSMRRLRTNWRCYEVHLISLSHPQTSQRYPLSPPFPKPPRLQHPDKSFFD